jgi:hypothetical protein
LDCLPENTLWLTNARTASLFLLPDIAHEWIPEGNDLSLA